MKIKNLNYIFGLLLGLIFCAGGVVFGACTRDMVGGDRLNDLPGDGYQEGQCRSYAQPGTNSWYDNHQTLSNDARAFIKMTDLSWADCNHSKVVAIQQKMQNLGPACSTCVDGRLGKHTTDAMSSGECHKLICPDPAKPATWNGSSLDCIDNYVLKTLNGNRCCVEAPTLGTPEMEQYSREQYLDASISITVSDDYYDDDVNEDTAKISASNADGVIPNSKIYIGTCSPIYGAIQCDLIIHVTGSDVTVTLDEGFFELEIDDIVVDESSEAVQVFTWVEPQDCGSTPKTDSGCTETYGPSYSQSGDCCVTQCSTPQKTGGGCNTGYIKDGSGCCIQNNCQNPPLSGTQDCSNQFGGRGVYSGAIECCIDSGSCVNPPSSPGQCSGNLVLDQAGQCCITCATPADGSGNCQSGYTVQGSCCFADNMCGDNQINQGGQCKACEEEGTKPNESHTRCICNPDLKCCGVQLNNVVPFIGDCIEMNGESNRDNTTNVTSVTAFPILMQGLMKILMSVIMIFSFLMIIVAGLLIVSGAFGGTGFTTGKKIIKNVIISLILLGCSGLILSLINPSFFK